MKKTFIVCAVVFAAALSMARAWEPGAVTNTFLHTSFTNKVTDSPDVLVPPTVLYWGQTLDFTDCPLYSAAGALYDPTAESPFKVEVRVGNVSTSITYAATVSAVGWSASVAVPSNTSFLVEVRINTNQLIYPRKLMVAEKSFINP